MKKRLKNKKKSNLKNIPKILDVLFVLFVFLISDLALFVAVFFSCPDFLDLPMSFVTLTVFLLLVLKRGERRPNENVQGCNTLYIKLCYEQHTSIGFLFLILIWSSWHCC